MVALVFAILTAAPVQLSLAPGSKLVIEGDSSMHAWKCEAIKFDGAGEATSIDAAGSLSAFELGIPVGELRCGNDTMDGKLREALKADKFARIDFEFISASPNGPAKLNVIGNLSIAGVEKKVAAVVTVARGAGNIWIATGTVPLKMSAFGVDPPSAFLGMMKTADAVTIRFELKIVAQAPQAHAAN